MYATIDEVMRNSKGKTYFKFYLRNSTYYLLTENDFNNSNSINLIFERMWTQQANTEKSKKISSDEKVIASFEICMDYFNYLLHEKRIIFFIFLLLHLPNWNFLL